MRATFTWDLRTDALAWSDPMFELYGYAAGEVAPTMRLLVEHKHPADRPRLQQLLRSTKRDPAPYVFRHRIVTAHDEVRDVVVAAHATDARRGITVEVTGTAVDLTGVITGPSFAADDREAAQLRDQVTHLEQALASRDLIGQAKGILMHTYRIGADEAFDLLRLASQRGNRKLVDVSRDVALTGRLDAG